jgi:hypothetical protein
MQTSSTDDRIRKELWGDLGEAAPARVGISNITIINPQINQPAGEAILAQGEPTLPIKGVQISGGKVGNIPPGKQPIKLVNADQSQVSNTVLTNSGSAINLKCSAGSACK